MIKAIGLCILNENKEVLILEHNKFNIFTFPVGKIEENETPLEAVHREAFEEIGIKFEDTDTKELIHEYTSYNNIKHGDEHLFFINSKDIIGTPYNKEPNKHNDMYWYPIDKLLELGTLGTLTHTFVECVNRGYITIKDKDNIIVNNPNRRIYKLDRAIDPAYYIIK